MNLVSGLVCTILLLPRYKGSPCWLVLYCRYFVNSFHPAHSAPSPAAPGLQPSRHLLSTGIWSCLYMAVTSGVYHLLLLATNKLGSKKINQL